MTAATMKISRTGPAARASTKSASTAIGSMTSCTQRATTTGDGGGTGSTSWSFSSVTSCVLIAGLLPEYARVPDAPATILFVGDVVGALGRRTLLGLLPALRERYAPTFVVVNGENIAGGLGITPKIADELFAAGVDVITLGNHTYRRKEIFPYLDAQERILRPANYLRSQPGHGSCVVERDGVRLGVVNLSGNVFLRAGRPAFSEVDAVLHDAARQGRPRARRHARRGHEREGRHGLVPRRPRHRGRRDAHPRADRRRARAAGRDGLHHRRRA